MDNHQAGSSLLGVYPPRREKLAQAQSLLVMGKAVESEDSLESVTLTGLRASRDCCLHCDAPTLAPRDCCTAKPGLCTKLSSEDTEVSKMRLFSEQLTQNLAQKLGIAQQATRRGILV